MFRMCLASRGPLGPLSFGRGIGAGSERDLQVLSGQGWPRAGGLRAGDEGMPVHKPCLKAVEEAFGGDANYAQLHKVYGYDANDTHYSPAPCIGCDMKTVSGVPDPSTTVVTNEQEAEAVVYESERSVPGIGDVFASQTRAEGDSGRASRCAARKRANAGFPVR